MESAEGFALKTVLYETFLIVMTHISSTDQICSIKGRFRWKFIENSFIVESASVVQWLTFLLARHCLRDIVYVARPSPAEASMIINNPKSKDSELMFKTQQLQKHLSSGSKLKLDDKETFPPNYFVEKDMSKVVYRCLWNVTMFSFVLLFWKLCWNCMQHLSTLELDVRRF